MNYFLSESQDTKELFNLDDILEVQLTSDIQILRGEDFQYTCYIDGEGYGLGLTPMYALVVGVKKFKEYIKSHGEL